MKLTDIKIQKYMNLRNEKISNKSDRTEKLGWQNKKP